MDELVLIELGRDGRLPSVSYGPAIQQESTIIGLTMLSQDVRSLSLIVT
jgi:hypothetical protein